MAINEETIESAEAEKDRSVSGQQIALVVGGIVVLLALVWFFFLRGDSAPEPAGQPNAPSSAPAGGAGNEDKKADKNKKNAPKASRKAPVENFEVFAPKDPFEPLVSSAAGGATDDTGGSTSGNDDTGGSSDTSGDDVGGHTVRLVDIFTADGEERAQVQVDGTVYRVSEGEVFADSFQLVSIQGDCATMLFGDDQFTLCQGEEILK